MNNNNSGIINIEKDMRLFIFIDLYDFHVKRHLIRTVFSLYVDRTSKPSDYKACVNNLFFKTRKKNCGFRFVCLFCLFVYAVLFFMRSAWYVPGRSCGGKKFYKQTSKPIAFIGRCLNSFADVVMMARHALLLSSGHFTLHSLLYLYKQILEIRPHNK